MNPRLPELLVRTLRLGGEVDDRLAEAWRGVDLNGLEELVGYEGAAIWLFRRLRAIGALENLPKITAERLRRLASESAASRMAVEAEAGLAVKILDDAAVPVILIKGMARCALSERYPYLDARATIDVDLLVPSSALHQADAALKREGYRAVSEPTPGDGAYHHHLPPLVRDGCSVELHESTSERIDPAIAWSRASTRSEVLRWAGQPVRVPSPTELAWHAIAHAMEDTVEDRVRGFRLNRFLELAALVSSGASIDWTEIDGRILSAEAFDQGAPVADLTGTVKRWIAAALTLVAPELRPAHYRDMEFNLAELLAWRLAVIRARPGIGRPFAERLLIERARAVATMPLDGSPPGASAWGRVRRGIAGRASRATFTLWRASRRG